MVKLQTENKEIFLSGPFLVRYLQIKIFVNSFFWKVILGPAMGFFYVQSVLCPANYIFSKPDMLNSFMNWLNSLHNHELIQK